MADWAALEAAGCSQWSALLPQHDGVAGRRIAVRSLDLGSGRESVAPSRPRGEFRSARPASDESTPRWFSMLSLLRATTLRAKERPSAPACSLSAHQTCSMTRKPKRPFTGVSVHHSHDSSWPASADWLDLRNHLVKTHGALPHDIDDLESYTDGTTGRRRHAEDRHQALHLAPRPASGG